MIDTLFDSYPNSSENLNFKKIEIRYIDAVEFNFENTNIFEFLKNQMKTGINLPNSLFEGKSVEMLPSDLDLRFSFKANEPKGKINLRFGSGTRHKKSTLFWETMIFSLNENVPNEKKQILNWVTKAHDLTHDWFFKIIEGDLEKRFE